MYADLQILDSWRCWRLVLTLSKAFHMPLRAHKSWQYQHRTPSGAMTISVSGWTVWTVITTMRIAAKQVAKLTASQYSTGHEPVVAPPWSDQSSPWRGSTARLQTLNYRLQQKHEFGKYIDLPHCLCQHFLTPFHLWQLDPFFHSENLPIIRSHDTCQFPLESITECSFISNPCTMWEGWCALRCLAPWWIFFLPSLPSHRMASWRASRQRSFSDFTWPAPWFCLRLPSGKLT